MYTYTFGIFGYLMCPGNVHRIKHYSSIWLKDVLDSNLFVLIFGSVEKSQISLKRVFKFAFLVAKLVAKLARICNVGHVLM